MRISLLHRAVPALVLAGGLAACADQDIPAAAPTTPAALLHAVPDLCQRLNHQELRGLAEPLGTPGQLPGDDRLVRCSIMSGTLSTDSLASLQLFTSIKPTAAEAASGMPTADPVSVGDAERGLLDGLGERSTFTYSPFEADLDVAEAGPIHESYELLTLDSNAIVTINLRFSSEAYVGPKVLEQVARSYTQQALNLMREPPAGGA